MRAPWSSRSCFGVPCRKYEIRVVHRTGPWVPTRGSCVYRATCCVDTHGICNRRATPKLADTRNGARTRAIRVITMSCVIYLSSRGKSPQARAGRCIYHIGTHIASSCKYHADVTTTTHTYNSTHIVRRGSPPSPTPLSFSYPPHRSMSFRWMRIFTRLCSLLFNN